MNLIERLEKAEGPSRELADEVLLACGWTQPIKTIYGESGRVWQHPKGPWSFNERPNPMEDMNEAIELVPEGWLPNLDTFRSDGNVKYTWLLWKPDNREGHNTGTHANIALALCIACLRARGIE